MVKHKFLEKTKKCDLELSQAHNFCIGSTRTYMQLLACLISFELQSNLPPVGVL